MTIEAKVEPVYLSWQPESGDYVAAFSARNRYRKVWIAVMTIVIGGGFAVMAMRAGVPEAAVIGVLIAVLGPVMGPVMERASTRAVWRRYPELHRPVQAVVDPVAGITASTVQVITISSFAMAITTAAELRWQEVGGVIETRSVFVVNLSGGEKRFLVLAKRGLAGPGQLESVRAMLTRRPPAHVRH